MFCAWAFTANSGSFVCGFTRAPTWLFETGRDSGQNMSGKSAPEKHSCRFEKRKTEISFTERLNQRALTTEILQLMQLFKRADKRNANKFNACHHIMLFQSDGRLIFGHRRQAGN